MDLVMSMHINKGMSAQEIADLVTAETLPADATIHTSEGRIQFLWTVTTN
jgi:hypothetical protein